LTTANRTGDTDAGRVAPCRDPFSAQEPAGCDREPLRIAQVIHAIAPESGGPSVTVPMLCEELGALGHRVRLHVTAFGSPPALQPNRFELCFHPHLPLGGRLGVSRSMHDALVREARAADVVHSHGLWLWTNLDVYWSTRHSTARTVVSPRGMLEPYALARSRFVKRLSWALGQRSALRGADCIHVTAESEYESVRALGLRNPVAVVPNGVKVPAARARPTGPRRRLLFLGRVDPKKGIDYLLQAWSRVASAFPDWDLFVVGPSEGSYERKMKSLAHALAAPRVTFLGAVFGEARDQQLASADLFVLPTRSENFGLSVAEALAAGVPVICSKGAPWSGILTERCGDWIDVGADPLAQALRATLALPREDLNAQGARGRSWMLRDFGWPAQSRKMAGVYQWLLGRGARPSYVRVD